MPGIRVAAVAPPRSRQPQQRHPGGGAGPHRRFGNRGGKRVGGVDDSDDALIVDVLRETLGATEPADPNPPEWECRFAHPAGERGDDRDPLGDEQFRKRPGLRRPPENQHYRQPHRVRLRQRAGRAVRPTLPLTSTILQVLPSQSISPKGHSTMTWRTACGQQSWRRSTHQAEPLIAPIQLGVRHGYGGHRVEFAVHHDDRAGGTPADLPRHVAPDRRLRPTASPPAGLVPAAQRRHRGAGGGHAAAGRPGGRRHRRRSPNHRWW